MEFKNSADWRWIFKFTRILLVILSVLFLGCTTKNIIRLQIKIMNRVSGIKRAPDGNASVRPSSETKQARIEEETSDDLDSLRRKAFGVAHTTDWLDRPALNLLKATDKCSSGINLSTKTITVLLQALDATSIVHKCTTLTLEGPKFGDELKCVTNACEQSSCTELVLRGGALEWLEVIRLVKSRPTLQSLSLVNMRGLPFPPAMQGHVALALRDIDIKYPDKSQLRRVSFEGCDMATCLSNLSVVSPYIERIDIHQCHVMCELESLLPKFGRLSTLQLTQCDEYGGSIVQKRVGSILPHLPLLRSLTTDWLLAGCNATQLAHLELRPRLGSIIHPRLLNDEILANAFEGETSLTSLNIHGAIVLKRLPYDNMPRLRKLNLSGSPQFDTRALLAHMQPGDDRYQELSIMKMGDSKVTAALAEWLTGEVRRDGKLPANLHLDAETCLRLMCADKLAAQAVIQCAAEGTPRRAPDVVRHAPALATPIDAVRPADLRMINLLLARRSVPPSTAIGGFNINAAMVDFTRMDADAATAMLTGDPIAKLVLANLNLTQTQLEQILQRHPEVQILSIVGNEEIVNMAKLLVLTPNVKELHVDVSMLTPKQMLHLMLEPSPTISIVHITDSKDGCWIDRAFAAKLRDFAKTRQGCSLTFSMEENYVETLRVARMEIYGIDLMNDLWGSRDAHLDAEVCLRLMCADNVEATQKVIQRAIRTALNKPHDVVRHTPPALAAPGDAVGSADLQRIASLLAHVELADVGRSVTGGRINSNAAMVDFTAMDADAATAILTGYPIFKLVLDNLNLTQTQLERIIRQHEEVRILSVGGNKGIVNMCQLIALMRYVRELHVDASILTPEQMLHLMLEPSPTVSLINITDSKDGCWIDCELAAKLREFAKTRQGRSLTFSIEENYEGMLSVARMQLYGRSLYGDLYGEVSRPGRV